MTMFRLCALLLSTMACLLCHTLAGEPACSRFDYEERLLEKMVRLEHDFRLLQDKWQGAQEALTASMAQADRQMVQMQTVSDASKIRIDAYNATMDSLVANFTSRADKQFAKQLNAASARGLVSFRVRKPAESSYTKSAINIRFLTVDLNLGNGYDATTGIFTAPVNGLYLFFAQLCVGKGSNVYIQIWKNDTAIQTSRIYESGSHHCCNAEVVDGLMKGDQISLKSASGHTSTIAGDSDIYFNSFSGSLLRQGE